MNKRYLHHVWRKLRIMGYGYFLVAFIAASVTFVWAYRNNNLTALKLRDQLLTADASGIGVEESLNKLRVYIYGHMNASLAGGEGSIYPPIQLKGTYARLVANEQRRVDDANAQASKDAQTTCDRQFPGRKTGYLLCLQDYEAAHTAVPQTIPDSLYKFDFASPRWSPDLAGWSLVAAIIFLAMFIIRLAAEVWLRFTLKSHA